jgi:hypothetical protein
MVCGLLRNSVNIVEKQYMQMKVGVFEVFYTGIASRFLNLDLTLTLIFNSIST